MSGEIRYEPGYGPGDEQGSPAPEPAHVIYVAVGGSRDTSMDEIEVNARVILEALEPAKQPEALARSVR